MLSGDLEAVKKRWRQLRDEFMRAKKRCKAYVPSGSATSDLPPKPSFKYYEMMRFLEDIEGTMYVFIFIIIYF